jgi:hypothetical protein
MLESLQIREHPGFMPQVAAAARHGRADGRPLAQWPRLKAGHSDDLGTGTRDLCQGQRHSLFPPTLRLQNQFYNFARSTPACQSLRDKVANRL